MNTTVRDGISIAEYNVIGAGSNLVKSTEPYGVYFGNPAKRLKDVDIDNIKI